MKKIALAAAAVSILFAGAASAADMAVKARPAPIPPPVFSWTGFYVGINAGGSWSDNSRDYVMPFTAPGNIFVNCGTPAGVPLPVVAGPNPFGLSADCGRPSSFIGGAQIGYNWQAGSWLFGVEADGAWQQLIERSFTTFGANPTPGSPIGSVAGDAAYFRSELNALGTFRGRIGYAPGPWLLYVTGGLAVGDIKHEATEVLAPPFNLCPTAPSPDCRRGTNDTTKVGWTIGAGAEWMFARNWSVGAEYLYVDLGSTTITLPPAGALFFDTSNVRFEDREHVVRAKLNYHFGGPVVAKY